MLHSFGHIPQIRGVSRSFLNRSCKYCNTFDADYLMPVFCDEVLPGDTFTIRPQMFARLITPKVPVIDNIYLDTFWFFCPERLLWENFVRMQGERDNPTDSIDYLLPQVIADPGPATGFGEDSIYASLGLPFNVPELAVRSGPFRMYNLIWNDWFRSQDLQDSVDVPLDDGPDDQSDFELLKRNKRPDYFTRSLPDPQKGSEVQLPLGSSAPVIGDGTAIGFEDEYTGDSYGYTLRMRTECGGDFSASADGWGQTLPYQDTSGADTGHDDYVFGLSQQAAYSGVIADLSAAVAGNIEDWRWAIAMQKFLERDQRGGTRYVEQLFTRWKVVCPDYRLQRPEYLGGSSTRINVIPIAQTSESGTTPQGHLAAMGVVQNYKGGFTKSFVEHGFIMCIVNVRADINYQTGLERMWSRRTRFEMYNPEFDQLGEQAILKKEIFCDGTSADDDVWSYGPHWDEYRYKKSIIAGLFNSNHSLAIDNWHLAEDITSVPPFNTSFITSNTPMDRCTSVQNEHHMKFIAHFEVHCARQMSTFGVPGLSGPM